MAVGDKQQAVAEKASLEQQLKQAQGKNLIIEKSLEKKDQIESKKRESIMIVSAAALMNLPPTAAVVNCTLIPFHSSLLPLLLVSPMLLWHSS